MTDEPSSAPRRSRRHTDVITLEDVARHAGVSAQTVSRAIRRPDLVSESTLAHVQRSITETGYVPNLAASHLASNRSQTVAAVVPAIAASVFSDALHGLDEVLTPAGYHLFIGSTEYDPEQETNLVRALLGRRPDGFFVVGTEHPPAARDLLAKANVPIVETWNWTETPIDSLVGFSNTAAIRTIVEYVHAQGYRRPTFAGWFEPNDFRAIERLREYQDVAGRLFPDEPSRIIDTGAQRISMDAGRWLVGTVLDQHPETDVLICSSDVFAAGALLECQRRGIDVPGRLGITGFGGFEYASHLVPTLTTIAIPNRRIGTVAGELLLERMDRRHSSAPRSVDVGFTLVEGGSTIQHQDRPEPRRTTR